MSKVNKREEPSREKLLEIIRPCHQHYNKAENDDDSKVKGSQRTFSERLFKMFQEGTENFKKLVSTAEIRKRSLIFWTIFSTVSMVW